MPQFLPSSPPPPTHLPDRKSSGGCAGSPANGHDPPPRSEDPGDSDCRSGGPQTEQLEEQRPVGEVGGGDGVPYQGLGDWPPPEKRHKLSIVPLVFLIFYEVSGGPFGVEDSVGAGGPLLALLGFLLFPLLWSVPEALITAELGTMFPENGGYVVWVSSALGPFCGFQQGWMKWLSGVIDNALYPVLFLDYLKSVVPRLATGPPRGLAALALTVLLTYMNYRGLTVVGSMAVFLGAFSILPFLVMGVVAVPKLKPKRWLEVDFHSVDWNLYLNTLFWNLNYWDSVSTLAGEVNNPAKTLPRSLFYAVILVVTAYLLPLLVGIGSLPVDRNAWADGYFADIALAVGGAWLSWWVRAAAAVSNMGMFVAEMSSDSYQLLGMAERGMLPEAFSRRSSHGTPLLGILFSASGVVLLSWLSFQEIVAAENFLYCFGMLMEFAAFVRLRMKHPEAARPYKIPLGTAGCVLMLVPPTALILVVLALSSLNVALVSGGAVALGLALRPGLQWAERRRWLRFSVNRELAELGAGTGETPDVTDQPPIRDVEVNSARVIAYVTVTRAGDKYRPDRSRDPNPFSAAARMAASAAARATAVTRAIFSSHIAAVQHPMASLLSRRFLHLRSAAGVRSVRRSPTMHNLPGFGVASRIGAIRCMARRPGDPSYSPLNSGTRGGSGFSDRPPTEMAPLFPGCDYEHWLIVMDKPGGEGASKQQMIDCYVQTLAKVLGSEEEAKKKIYNVSCERYFGFGCEMDEETSNKLEGIPGVLFVLPDSYVDAENKDYGAELFVNGEIVQRPPERQRRIDAATTHRNERDRPRYNDRTRYVRRRESQR